jgi:hypothetical protein
LTIPIATGICVAAGAASCAIAGRTGDMTIIPKARAIAAFVIHRDLNTSLTPLNKSG